LIALDRAGRGAGAGAGVSVPERGAGEARIDHDPDWISTISPVQAAWSDVLIRSNTMAQPLTLAKLSSLSTSTLSSILELTRAHQLSLPATQLITTIARNLATLNNGIAHLHHQGQQGEPLKALEAQYDRLVNLVTPLGVDVPPQAQPQGKTGRLVDTGDEDDDDDLVAVGGEE